MRFNMSRICDTKHLCAICDTYVDAIHKRMLATILLNFRLFGSIDMCVRCYLITLLCKNHKKSSKSLGKQNKTTFIFFLFFCVI